MARSVRSVVVACTATALMAAAVPSALAASSSGSVTLLVTAKHGKSVHQAVSRNGGNAGRAIDKLGIEAVTVPSGQASSYLKKYRADADVASAEVQGTRHAASVATDPSYGDQWALPKIGWEGVHGVVSPSGTATLAVLDTGVSASADVTLVPGWSAFGTDPTDDTNGHGTALASIAAASADDNVGIAGVAFSGVSVMPVQVLGNDGTGSDGDVIDGIVHAADAGADVILMGFSNPGYSQALQDAVSYAWSKGAVLVAATGNDGSTTSTFPAGDAHVVGVSATDSSDALASSSNSGEDAFLGAPGVGIAASDVDGTTRSLSGTSASAAIVAGSAALLKANDGASNGVIVGRLARNADAAGSVSDTGNGRINIARAIADTSTTPIDPAGTNGAANGGPIVGPYVAAAAPLSPQFEFNPGGGGTIRLYLTGNGDPNSNKSYYFVLAEPSPSTTTYSSTCQLGIATHTFDLPQNYAVGTWRATAYRFNNNQDCNTDNAKGIGSNPVPVAVQVTISGGVVNDANGDGVENDGAGGVTAATLHLYKGAAAQATHLAGDQDLGTTPSDSSGAYAFTGLGTGTYFVVRSNPAGWVSTNAIPATGGSASKVDNDQLRIVLGSSASSTNNDFLARVPSTTTTLTSSSNPSTYGNSVTFTATVTGTSANPTSGTVTFKDGTTAICTNVALNASSQATCSTSTLSVGNHNITAEYSGVTGPPPFAASTSSILVQGVGTRPITVTATAHSQVYGAAAIPLDYTITAGSLAPGDSLSGSLSRAAGNNVGSYAISQNTLANPSYTITYVGANYTITARPITVTAATDSKTYDGTTSSSATPTITSGTLAGTDTATWMQSFANRNVGTGKTLTPTGSVSDGNGGNNYAVTFANNTSGVISAKAITVTAVQSTKTYDGSTSSTGTPTITSGNLVGGDTAVWTQTFDTRHVGTAKTLTPAGTITDGNGGNNYSVTLAPVSTGVINARAITVTASTDSRVYDGTTNSAGSPSITSGSLYGTDTAHFTQAYATPDVGTGKTIVPGGYVDDGNSGHDYAITFANNTTGVITGRAITVTADPQTQVYGESPADLTYKITSGSLLPGDSLSGQLHRAPGANVGTYAIDQGDLDNANYTITFVGDNYVITVRHITVTATHSSKTYDGSTSSSDEPTITLGSLASGDTVTWTQTFDTKNVGTGKTLTPAGTVNDGNGGANYAVTFVNDTTGVISQRAITVKAAHDGKTYDGTTNSAGLPTITVGTLALGDSATWTQTFDNKNVGTGKTLTPAGSVNDGYAGANYLVTFANDTTGVISQRAITVTGATDSKTYDGNTSSVGVPTITSGTLATGDTATWSQVFDTKDIGTGKALIPSGSVSDGNGGHNYLVTFANDNTGVIGKRAITVTAVPDTKTYDGDTSSTGVPTISGGTLAPGDTAGFTQAFANRNVGTGKTLQPSGTVNDGNGGDDYDVTFVNNHTGVVNARAITVTAVTSTKPYDGTTSSSGTPTITSGDLVGGDTATWTQTFDTKNVGTGKTLTPTGTVIDGNSGNNYDVTFANDTTGVITARAITVTAVTSTKTYDGDTSSSGVPTITVGSLAPGDSVIWTETFDSKNVGTGKTLTPAGTVGDGNGGANYVVTFENDTTGVISQRAITVTAATDTKTYDGTVTSTGAPSITTGSLVGSDVAHFTQTFDTRNVGTGKTLTPTGYVADGNLGLNYGITFVPVATGAITTRAITVTAVPTTKTYDGNASSAGTPSITTGSLGAGDSAGFTQVYANRNAGTGKTLIPSGAVVDGNSGHNYVVTFVNNYTGVINQRALTVTAVADTKTYDGGTSSTGVPTITSGTLVGGDTAGFTQDFVTRNVGTGKTITPHGMVNDGNGGGNYAVTFVSVYTGTITKRAITVTAVTSTKPYDGTTSSSGVPTITSGDLVGGDTATWTQTFDTKNVGTGKTLTPAGTVSDGNGGANYAVTFVNNTTGVITTRAITVTAVTGTKPYDGTQGSSGTPTITAGSLAPGDTATWTQTFDTRNVGTGKTLTPAGTVTDGNSGHNYTVTFVNNTTGVITARTITVTAATGTKVFDNGTSSNGVPTITSGSLAPGDSATWTQTYDTKNVGTGKTLTPAGSVSDGNSGNNYAVTFVNNTTGVITARPITITPTQNLSKTYGDTFTFTGNEYSITSGTLAPGDSMSLTLSSAGSPSSALAGSYPIVISNVTFTSGPASNYAITNGTANLLVNARQANAAYIGQTVFVTSGSSSTTAQVTLTASIAETGDPSGGNITNSTATFTDVSTGKVLASNVKVTPVSNTDTHTGTANTVVTLSSGQYGAQQYVIRVTIAGSYINSQQINAPEDSTAFKAAQAIVTVLIPSTTSSMQGATTFTPASPAGTYADASGPSYSIGMKYNSKGTSPQGQIQLILPRSDGTYYVKSNSITSVAFSGSQNKDVTIYTKASIYKILASGQTVSVDGGVTLRVDAHDGCSTASCTGDTIGFTVLSGKDSALYYSNNWAFATDTQSWRTIQQAVPGPTGVVIN